MPDETATNPEETGPAAEVAAVAAADDSTAAPGDQEQRVQRLLDMKVPVIVKVAQRKMTVRDVLRLNMGSIIQFEKDAYEHVELMVNNTAIGLGQPVKVGENFGLRLIQVGDVAETIRSLGAPPDE